MVSTTLTLSIDGRTKKPSLQNDIPEEIVLEIMTRLPAKAILRFKSVCKSLCRQLSDPSFIQMHLHRTIAKGNTSVLLRHIAPEEKRSYEWEKKRTRVDVTVDEMGNQTVTYATTRHFEENFDIRSSTNFQDVICKPQLPVHWRRRFTIVVGSSHGIVCIVENDDDSDDFRSNKDLALWNPATTELKLLPKLANGRTHSYVAALGFTYNLVLNDYQVVSIIISESTESDFETQVLSVSTNHWREVDDARSLTCTFHDFVSNASVGGNLHWLASDVDDGILWHAHIVYLDTTKDKFGTIEYPSICAGRKLEAVLQSYCLGSDRKESLLLFLHDTRFIIGCDVWFMQEYGNASSWTRLYVVPLTAMMKPIGNYHGPECETLVGRLEDDHEEGYLYACCPRPILSVRRLGVRTPTCIFGHMETLVPISQLPAMLMGSSSSASTSNA
ncbi:F-box/kelch-repeat protein At3g06240 [Linum grandiflorum]